MSKRTFHMFFLQTRRRENQKSIENLTYEKSHVMAPLGSKNDPEFINKKNNKKGKAVQTSNFWRVHFFDDFWSGPKRFLLAQGRQYSF